MRAVCVALLATVALACARTPAPGVDDERRRQTTRAADPGHGPVAVAPRGAGELAGATSSPAALPPPPALPKPPRAVLPAARTLRHVVPRSVAVPARARAPPSGSPQVV